MAAQPVTQANPQDQKQQSLTTWGPAHSTRTVTPYATQNIAVGLGTQLGDKHVLEDRSSGQSMQ